VLAVEHPPVDHRAQFGDLVPGAEPPGQDDLLHRLPARFGLPVTSGRQGLEVDRIGQERAQRAGILDGQRPRETLARGHRDGRDRRDRRPAVSS